MSEELKIANMILKLSNNVKFISEQNLKHLDLIIENAKSSREHSEEINSLKEDVVLLIDFVLFLKKKQEENNCNCEHKLKEKV